MGRFQSFKNSARPLNLAIALAMSVAPLSGCKVDAGFQGGLVPSQFSGIGTLRAISPDSVKISWTAQSGASKYNIYSSSSNSPVLKPSNTTVIFQPDAPRLPSTVYQYSVTAVANGVELGDRTRYASVSLLPRFNFKEQATLTAVSDTAVRISWAGNPEVTYKFFKTERTASGAVDYARFLVSMTSNPGDSSMVVTGLTPGHEYCFVGVASYLDNKSDGPDGTPFDTDVSTTMEGWASLNGSFYGSKVYLTQKCVRTTSSASVSIANVKVYSPHATFSEKPTFYATSSAANIKTTIYQVIPGSYTATFIGERLGNGEIQSGITLSSGKYQFYSITTKMDDINRPQSRNEINITGTFPADEDHRQYLFIRNFKSPVAPADDGGFYPEKLQGGKGPQRAGSAVAMGDFNCDGKMDLAVGVPEYMTMAQDGRPAKLGKVVIYYDFNSGTPSTSSSIQNVIFDITGLYGESGRNLGLGTGLTVGNFNGDTQDSNQSDGTPRSTAFGCDDLVINSKLGPVFVAYGKRSIQSVVTAGNNDDGKGGGINYTNPTAFSLNPTSSCDPVSRVCQPASYIQLTTPAQSKNKFNVALAFAGGDYNGDGYQDLAVSNAFVGPQDFYENQLLFQGVWVFRGSLYGLIPPKTTTNGTFAVGPEAGFPQLDSSSFTGNSILMGTAIGAIANSYYDTATKRVKDILVVGDAAAGKAFACKAIQDSNNKFFSVATPLEGVDAKQWSCSSIGTPSGSSGFGTAIASVKNALRYSPQDLCPWGNQVSDNTSSTDCIVNAAYDAAATPKEVTGVVGTRLGQPGAVAISGGGKIYVYYAVANARSGSSGCAGSGRDRNGCELNYYMTQLFASTSVLGNMETGNNAPCSVDGSGYDSCKVQVLSHPSNIGGGFGLVMNVVPGNKDVSSQQNQAKDSMLAVAAPYKSVTIGSNTYNNVGTVQVFQQNNFYDANPATLSNSVVRFSDGFSKNLTFPLDYTGTLRQNVYFGLGGVAGGATAAAADLENYKPSSDLVVGAPGYTTCTVDGGCTTGSNGVLVYDNGAAFTFFSHNGTYRNYAVGGSIYTPSPWHVLDYNNSQENSIHYHQVVAVPNLANTGSDSIIVRIAQGYDRNKMRIFNGLTSSVGFGSGTDFQVPGDTTAGIRIVPIGKIGTSNYPVVLITSKTASYLYFGGVTGLLFGTPSAYSTGGNPRKLSNEGTDSDPSGVYLDFSDSKFWNQETSGDADSEIGVLNSFASGDFNGDGYGDFAIGFNSNDTIRDFPSNGTNSPASGAGYGRVFVFYGGADNGIQTQANVYGGYRLDGTQFVSYDGTQDVQPCSASGTGCKIQMLYGPSETTTFGRTLAAVPIGTCVVNGQNVPVHGLAVSSQTYNGTNGSKVYLFKPTCLPGSGTGNKSGLAFANTASSPKVILSNSVSASTGAGVTMVPVKKLLGATGVGSSIDTHLVVSESYFVNSTTKTYKLHVLPVNTTSSTVAGAIANSTCAKSSVLGAASDIAANSVGATDNALCGGMEVDYTNLNILTGISYDVGFGTGLTAVGDINGDGFSDLALGFSKLPRREGSSIVDGQGAVVWLFGSTTGLQAKSGTATLEPSREARCFKDSATGGSTCLPTLMYLPVSSVSARQGAYDRLMITPYSALTFHNDANDGLGSILLSVPNRDTTESDPTARTLYGGGFNVLP